MNSNLLYYVILKPWYSQRLSSELCWEDPTLLEIVFLPLIVFLFLLLTVPLQCHLQSLSYWSGAVILSVVFRLASIRLVEMQTYEFCPRLESESLLLIEATFHKRGYAVRHQTTLFKFKTLFKKGLSWALEYWFCGLYFGFPRN